MDEGVLFEIAKRITLEPVQSQLCLAYYVILSTNRAMMRV